MAPVRITIFRFTGRQGFFSVPEAWCRECDMMVRAADEAAARSTADVTVVVKPWWVHVVPALLKGGWHPPLLLVNGRHVLQGRVPRAEELDDAIARASADEGTAPRRFDTHPLALASALVLGFALVALLAVTTKVVVEAATPRAYDIHWSTMVPALTVAVAYVLNRTAARIV